jgi:hypothetical protein
VRIENIHERALPAGTATAVGGLIEGLAGADDRLWPHDRWPAMRLDAGLRRGSRGGHGPIRYEVVEHQPGCLVRFRFLSPTTLVGEHAYELNTNGTVPVLRHVLRARAEGRMRWQWPLLVKPLHDALIEDSLDRAVATVSATTYKPERWSWRVCGLRWLSRTLL